MKIRDYAVLAAIALIPRLLFLWAIPLASGSPDPNCAPDELAHFWATREMSFGRLAPWSPGSVSIYSSFLPTQYVFQAAALASGRLLGGDIVRIASPERLVAGYGFARLGSVILGLVTVVALTQAAWLLTRSRREALIAGLVVALLPQLVFVNAYVNADAFTIAVGALLTCSLVRWVQEPQQRLNTILLGIALGLVVLGKLSGYYLLPPTAALIALELQRHKNARPRWIDIVAACLAVAGPVLLWNAARSGGDVLGLQAYSEFIAHHWTRNPAPGPQPWRTFFAKLGMSTFGTFRNMDLFLPMPLYWCALSFAVAGLLVAVSRWREVTRTVRLLVAWLICGAVIDVAAVWWNSWVVDFQPQGRYILLPAACVGMIAAIAPLRALPRAGARLWAALIVLFFAVSIGYSAFLLFAEPCLP